MLGVARIRRRGGSLTLLYLSLFFLHTSVSFAEDEDKTNALAALRVASTDNIDLQSDGKKEDETFIEALAGFKRGFGSEHNKLDLEYYLRYFAYKNESDNNQDYHHLAANAFNTIVKKTLFLKTDVRVDPTLVDDQGPSYIYNAKINNNLVTSTRWSVNPYLQHTLASGHLMRASYRLGGMRHDDSSVTESDDQKIEAFYKTQLKPGRPFFKVNYSLQDTDYDDGSEYRLERGDFESRIPAQRSVSLIGAVGYEDSSSDTSGRFDDSSVTWRVGFLWQPTERTRLEFTGGERVFGEEYKADFSHQTKRTKWQARYIKDLDTTTSLGLSAIRRDEQGPLVSDEVSNPSLTSELYLREFFESSISLFGRRTVIELKANAQHRNYKESGDSDQTIRTVTTVSWKIFTHSELAVSADWRDYETRVRDQYEEWGAGFVLNHALRRGLIASLLFRHRDRDASYEQDGYKENFGSVKLEHSF